jgi:hypothetical protein
MDQTSTYSSSSNSNNGGRCRTEFLGRLPPGNPFMFKPIQPVASLLGNINDDSTSPLSLPSSPLKVKIKYQLKCPMFLL